MGVRGDGPELGGADADAATAAGGEGGVRRSCFTEAAADFLRLSLALAFSLGRELDPGSGLMLVLADLITPFLLELELELELAETTETAGPMEPASPVRILGAKFWGAPQCPPTSSYYYI